MQNKWNQSKQKAAGLILFITNPRVSNASPDIHSQMERGNPAGPPWGAGTGRASHGWARAHSHWLAIHPALSFGYSWGTSQPLPAFHPTAWHP